MGLFVKITAQGNNFNVSVKYAIDLKLALTNDFVEMVYSFLVCT